MIRVKRRRGYITVAALALLGLTLVVVSAIARYATDDFRQAARAEHAALARQAAVAARDWSHLHADALSGDWQTLAVDGLLPATTRGTLTLRVRDTLVECRVVLRYAGGVYTWNPVWPVSAAAP